MASGRGRGCCRLQAPPAAGAGEHRCVDNKQGPRLQQPEGDGDGHEVRMMTMARWMGEMPWRELAWDPRATPAGAYGNTRPRSSLPGLGCRWAVSYAGTRRRARPLTDSARPLALQGRRLALPRALPGGTGTGTGSQTPAVGRRLVRALSAASPRLASPRLASRTGCPRRTAHNGTTRRHADPMRPVGPTTASADASPSSHPWGAARSEATAALPALAMTSRATDGGGSSTAANAPHDGAQQHDKAHTTHAVAPAVPSGHSLRGGGGVPSLRRRGR